jgi:hypothetical protein
MDEEFSGRVRIYTKAREAKVQKGKLESEKVTILSLQGAKHVQLEEAAPMTSQCFQVALPYQSVHLVTGWSFSWSTRPGRDEELDTE